MLGEPQMRRMPALSMAARRLPWGLHATLMTGTYPGAHGVRNNGRFRLPDEAQNRADIHPDTRKGLQHALEAEQSRFPAGPPAPEARDAGTLEMLEALGYVQ